MTPEAIAQLLAQAIRENEYPPGTALVQEELARRFSVSRNPVREALRILVAEGLVTMVQGSGAKVHMHSRQELDELYDLRLVLEQQIAPYIVEGVTQRAISALRALIEKMQSATTNSEWMRHNFNFHIAVYELADRPHTVAMLRGLLSAVQPYSFENIELSGGHDDSDQAHTNMISALENSDAERLADLFTSHLERTRSRLDAHYKELEQATQHMHASGRA